MLIEIILKGLFSDIDLSFLSKIISNSKEARFNSPESYLNKTFEEISEIIHSNEYVDFVITTDVFNISEKVISNVFVNLTKDGDSIELLIYFDLLDLNNINEMDGINTLMDWTDKFKRKYNFNYYVCQLDNADEHEYYFDSNGVGPLLSK